MWAAIRYRPAQSVALMLLSALVTACAVFAPLYQRALEQSLLQEGLLRHDARATAVALTSVATPGQRADAAAARSIFPASLSTVYDDGHELWSGRVDFIGVAGQPSQVSVLAPQDGCARLLLTVGRCPGAPFEIAVTAAEAKLQGWQLGATLTAPEHVTRGVETTPFAKPFRVVGLYTQPKDPASVALWMYHQLDGKAGRATLDQEPQPLMDDWVTTRSTFATGWSSDRVEVDYLLDRGGLSLDEIGVIPPAVQQLTLAGDAAHPSIGVTTGIADVVDEVVAGQQQASVLVPLLLAQLALLGIAVLVLVTAAAVDQRRPEIALARLRGRSPAATTRLVVGELGIVAAAGIPLGFSAAVALSSLSRALWLTPGVPFELPWSAVVAAGLSLAAILLAVVLAVRPATREPVVALLRRVPPRRRRALGLVEACVIVLALVGVVTIVGGTVTGPLALATPGLLALAVGVALAALVVRVAASRADADQPPKALAARLATVQVARRPSVKRIVAVTTVATALVVFATDALVVGARNRDERAQVEVGAGAVLTTNAKDVGSLSAAVKAADPTGRAATPVVLVHQGSSEAMTTLAVRPEQFRQVAAFPRQADAFDWAAIESGSDPASTFYGKQLSVSVSKVSLLEPDTVPAPRSPGAAPHLVVTVTPVDAPEVAVDMGELPPKADDTKTFVEPVPCQGGCRLGGLAVKGTLHGTGVFRGGLLVGPVSVDGQAPLSIGSVPQWQAYLDPGASPGTPENSARPLSVGAPAIIAIAVDTRRDVTGIRASSDTSVLPALLMGPLPIGTPGPLFQAAGIDGISLPMTQAGSVPYAPGGGTTQAIVDLDRLARRAAQLGSGSAAQVWVSDETVVPQVSAGLKAAGVDVLATQLLSDRKALFDHSAAAWGLQLALVVGLAALIVAVLVVLLVAASSWRSRTRDLSALRMAGVPRRTLRSASVLEQVTLVAVGVFGGAVAGQVGAQLAMPIVPFFSVPSAVLPIDATAASAQVAAAVAACLLVLLSVGALVGTRLAQGSSLVEARDQL